MNWRFPLFLGLLAFGVWVFGCFGGSGICGIVFSWALWRYGVGLFLGCVQLFVGFGSDDLLWF